MSNAAFAWPPEEHEVTEESPRVRTHVESGVGYVVMDRPDRRNALDAAMRTALLETLAAWQAVDDVRVVVITGIGRSFAAGADLREMMARTADEQRAFVDPPNVFGAIWDFPRPVIACINGHALGAGSELLLACDLRVAGDQAKLGQPETNLGLIPGGGGTQRLPRLVGYGRAMELVLTGRIVDAEEAGRLGWVERVVPQDALHDEARKLAESLAAKSPVAMTAAKRAMQAAWERPLEQGLADEIDRFMEAFASDDAREGITAFLERRPPAFTGR